MAFEPGCVGHDLTEFLDRRESEIIVGGNLKHTGPLLGAEKFAVGVEQLQGVPLHRVMAGRDDYSAESLLAGHGYFGRRSRGETDVDDIEAHACEGRTNQRIDHRP